MVSVSHLVVATLLALPCSLAQSTSSPTVTVKNGTYVGLHNDFYNVDAFLGMPFAQPAVGELRLNLPASLNTSWTGVRNATEFSAECVQYTIEAVDRPISEDCLSINVWRPAGYENETLPVLVWIYGGGLTEGSNLDPRYNLTFIIANSVQMGKPIMAANINYRVNGFGFLQSPTLQAAGLSNLGYRDQRLALHWIQENIGAFGGDPSAVTIWGQSAGANSVGAHLIAFGGRNDSLFRGAIADSGGPIGSPPASAAAQATNWNWILNHTNCAGLNDTAALDCLRSVSSEEYIAAVNGTTGKYGLVYDGDFIETNPSKLLDAGKFLRVPFMSGSNHDEGTEFTGGPPNIGLPPVKTFNDTDAFVSFVESYVVNASALNSAVAAAQVLYPDLPAIGIPHTYHGRLNASFGDAYKRCAAFAGDYTIHRGRRYSAIAWSKYDTPYYSYHYDQWPIGGLQDFTGTTHFTEIQLVFDDASGNGYVLPWYPSGSEFAGMDQGFYALAKLMSRMWISFAHDLTPNNHGFCAGHNGVPIAEWPVYAANATDAEDLYGVNMHFLSTHPGLASLEKDTYRAEAINWFMQNTASVFDG